MSDAEHLLHVPIACDGFITLGLWLNVSIHFRLSLPTAFAKCRSEIIVSLALLRSWRISHIAGTAHHPTIRNNVLGVSVFNFQVSKRFSLSYIYWENFFRIVLLDYNTKIHSLQISKSYIHSIKNVIEKVLEVENSSNADNAIVQIRQYSDTRTNDNWIFEEVNFGSAPNYDDIAVGEIRPPNCGGFALRLTDLVSDLQLELPQWSSVEACAIKTKEIFDGLDLGREIRIIYDYDTPTFPIADNEYRVAIRVRTTSSGYPNWDYHYQIQLDDGSWAHKQGGLASEKLGFVNPSRTEAWAHGYNSNVLYFAVTY